jgi:hypothetical protein
MTHHDAAADRSAPARCPRTAGARAALAALTILAGAALMAGPAAAAPVPQARSISFSGSYSGSASLLIDNGVVTISSVTGHGQGSLVGSSRVSGSGTSSSSAQCDPFSGTGALSGASGSIKFAVSSSTAEACSNGETAPITVSFHGTAKARGGTGKAEGARGSLAFKGTLNLGGTTGSQTGSFKVTLSGTLAVK